MSVNPVPAAPPDGDFPAGYRVIGGEGGGAKERFDMTP